MIHQKATPAVLLHPYSLLALHTAICRDQRVYGVRYVTEDVGSPAAYDTHNETQIQPVPGTSLPLTPNPHPLTPVPCRAFDTCCCPVESFQLSPKSAILAVKDDSVVPEQRSSTLAGVRSPCTTLRECTCAMPARSHTQYAEFGHSDTDNAEGSKGQRA